MDRYQQHFHALGSEVVLTIVTDQHQKDAQVLLEEMRAQINAFEDRFSRFRETSELSTFNNRAGNKVAISESFRKLLLSAQTLSKQTEGIYNPFILPALQRAGYQGSWPKPDSFQKSTDYSDGEIVPINKLHIEKDWAKIPPHTALDFGGIGKGYLLDQLAHYISDKEVSGYWFSLGGDIICGGHDLRNKDWHIAVGGAEKATEIIATVSNDNGEQLAIATSGVTKRKGTKSGKDWHHIIDPRTGTSSATDILTVTVTAHTAVVADVYAKCIVVTGRDHSEAYRIDGIIQSYIIQGKDGSVLLRDNTGR
jgi:thiamine biosynthesis lipoprotein